MYVVPTRNKDCYCKTRSKYGMDTYVLCVDYSEAVNFNKIQRQLVDLEDEAMEQ